jgi:hypothetical protein
VGSGAVSGYAAGAMSSVYCQHCGAPRTSGDATCEFCGTVFPGATAPKRADGAPPGVVEALRGRNKIEAIKLYREATGLGLKESKDAVEALEKRLAI